MATNSNPSVFDKILGAVTDLGTTYANMRLTERAGMLPLQPAPVPPVAPPPPPPPTAAAVALKPWIIPGAIVAFVLVVALLLPRRR